MDVRRDRERVDEQIELRRAVLKLRLRTAVRRGEQPADLGKVAAGQRRAHPRHAVDLLDDMLGAAVVDLGQPGPALLKLRRRHVGEQVHAEGLARRPCIRDGARRRGRR